jgi:hypothetical protein
MRDRGTPGRSWSGADRRQVRVLLWLLVVALGVGVLPAVVADPSAAQEPGTDRPFERTGALTLATGENGLRSAVIDPAGRFAYVGTGTSPARVVKLDLTTFARVGAITLATGENQLTSAVMDPSGRFAYFGTATDPGRVVKVDLTTFARVGAITLATGENQLTSAVMDPSGRFAYFGTATEPGRVVQVDLTTFTRIRAVALATGENRLRSAVIDPVGRSAYFGTGTEPGRVVKVDLTTLTRMGAVALATGEDQLWSAVIDPAGKSAYLGTRTYPARVVKIDLVSFARVGAVALAATGETANLALAAVIDPAGRFAYFVTDTDPHEPWGPGRVVRIDLSTFTRAGSVALTTYENVLWSAVIDPVGQYAYVSTSYTWPGRVVKVAVGPEPVLVTRLLTTYATRDGWDAHLAADVTGNGRADLLSYHPARGRWWITSSRRDGTFEPPKLLTTYNTRDGWEAHLAADVTGNGRADLLSYHPARGRWWITSARADGSFEPPRLLTTYNTRDGWETHLAADVTGNRRAELLSYHPSRGRWWLTASRADGGFETPVLATTYATRDGWEAHLAADVTGNGRADLLSYHPQQARWFASAPRADGTFESSRAFTTYGTTSGWATHLAADVSGNGRADLLSYHAPRGRWWATGTVPG